MSREVADSFVEALRKPEEDRDAEAIVSAYTEDCEVGNVAALEWTTEGTNDGDTVTPPRPESSWIDRALQSGGRQARAKRLESGA